MGTQTDIANFYANGGRALSEAFTGFNELTVSASTPLIDLKSIYGISDLRDVVVVTGSGSVTTERGLYKVSTGATSSSTASLTSVEYGRYVAGFEATPGLGVMPTRLPTGNEVGRWGYFDADDGFGFGIDAEGLFTFLRSGGVETIHRKSAWRRANFDVNLDNITIYRMPFRWYGSGPVSFEVSYVSDYGTPKLQQVDRFKPASGEPITENPNLPINVEVDNGGDSTDFGLFVGGRQFFVQGKYDPNRRITDEYILEASTSTSFAPLISWQQKLDFESVSVKVEGVVIAATGADVIYELRVDGTLAGEAFVAPSDIPASETALEFDTSATAITGGQKIFTGIATAGQGNSSEATSASFPDIPIGKDVTLTLCARTISGSGTATAILKAREEW